MRNRWYRSLVLLSRATLRRLVGGWSLERKSLLFFGVALVVPIGLAFWFVLQVVANNLVMQTTHQAARDYARAEIAWRHASSVNSETLFPSTTDTLSAFKVQMVENPDYSIDFLMLDNEVQHQDLNNAARPANEREARFLQTLEEKFRAGYTKLAEARQAAEAALNQAALSQAVSGAADNIAADQSNTPDNPESADKAPATEPTIRDLRAGVGMASSFETLESAIQKDPRVISAADELEALFVEDPRRTNRRTGAESPDAESDEGVYVYYHAVHFPQSCLQCHYRFKETSAQDVPFRAVKVMIPYSQTQVASTSTLAVMITIGMVTIAVTLFVVHWVLRRLVLNPLQHLHSVSDEISRGNKDLRANIDTGDEFNELADAFNRMLRHMTEGQEQLRKVNNELDMRVDQLAQANLNLYEANRLKSDFLANMSHELRTPLNSIIGFSDVLSGIETLSGKQKRYASNIQSSGKLLLEMINDILDLAKVEAGKMQVTPTMFELPSLISSQCDLMQPLVDEKNVDLRIECAEGLPPVFQDAPKLLQILTNLLSNAIKFTPDGGMITVRANCPRPEFAQITVEDTGVGIPESDFEVIFEKFRQSNAVLQNGGLTRQYAGTGLGLSIVKELCKLLGGEIRLSSQLGTGSVFRVILPVMYDESRQPTSELSDIEPRRDKDFANANAGS